MADPRTLTQGEIDILTELKDVEIMLKKAVALVQSGTPDEESGILLSLAKNHLDEGMKFLNKIVRAPASGLGSE